MMWETSIRKRNTNNEIKFIVPTDQEVNMGDVIIGQYSAEQISCYEITEIRDRREASLIGKDYITALIKWTNKRPVFDDFNLITDAHFDNLFNLKI